MELTDIPLVVKMAALFCIIIPRCLMMSCDNNLRDFGACVVGISTITSVEIYLKG